MQAIRTASRIGIDQRRLQIVFAHKPAERACRSRQPFRSLICSPRGQARGNRCAGLDWLLIERVGLAANLAEALRANRPEASRGSGLKRHEPTQRSEAHLDVPRRVGRQASLNQSLRKTRIVVSENVFKPEPVFALACKKQRHQTVGQKFARAVSENISGLQCAISIQAQKREGPRAWR
jgi:hypothetical protein